MLATVAYVAIVSCCVAISIVRTKIEVEHTNNATQNLAILYINRDTINVPDVSLEICPAQAPIESAVRNILYVAFCATIQAQM